MSHYRVTCIVGEFHRLGSFVADEGDNHAVEVEEEHEEVESQLDEGFLRAELVGEHERRELEVFCSPSYGR